MSGANMADHGKAFSPLQCEEGWATQWSAMFVPAH